MRPPWAAHGFIGAFEALTQITTGKAGGNLGEQDNTHGGIKNACTSEGWVFQDQGQPHEP